MSKKFRNLKTGLIEEVFNADVIEQCERHTETFEEVKETKKNTKASKKEPETQPETEE